jgi:SOS-response transcriptional repressor LexA
MIGLTPRMREALVAVEAFIARHGVAPTRRELALLLGLQNWSGADRLLRCLEYRGYIKLTPRYERNIVVLQSISPNVPRRTISNAREGRGLPGTEQLPAKAGDCGVRFKEVPRSPVHSP